MNWVNGCRSDISLRTTGDKAHLESIAREIRNGHGYVDDTEPHMVDAVRTALVVLGELTDVEHDQLDE